MTQKPEIIDEGRGPQLSTSRITVYDVMDYYLEGWPAGRIANWLDHNTEEIQVAIDYIESHRSEVDEEFRKILERCERGNSPEVRAIYEASRPLVEAKKAEILRRAREAKTNSVSANGSHR